MQSIDEYFEITQTSPSDYTEENIESIKKVFTMINQNQTASASYALLFSFSSSDEGRAKGFVRKSNDLLKRLAAAGIDRYQCELGMRIMDGEIAPPKGESRADAALGWLEKSYRQNFAGAAAGLAMFYDENRKGYQRDAEKVAFYWHEAERLGYDPINPF